MINQKRDSCITEINTLQKQLEVGLLHQYQHTLFIN